MAEDPETIRTRLAAALTRHLDSPVRIQALERLSGGASRETWSFDAVSEATATLPLILQRDPPGNVQASTPGLGGNRRIDRAAEFRLLQSAQAGGVPVPGPRFALNTGDAGDAGDAGTPGTVLAPVS